MYQKIRSVGSLGIYVLIVGCNIGLIVISILKGPGPGMLQHSYSNNPAYGLSLREYETKCFFVEPNLCRGL